MSGSAAPRKKLILVAEDDPAIRKMLATALSQKYKVEVAADGGEALTRLSAPPAPDLLLCDVMMPGLDGVGLARAMKKSPTTKGVPVIFLTAKSGSLDVIAGIQAGAKHYVTKPFVISDLLGKIAKTLGD